MNSNRLALSAALAFGLVGLAGCGSQASGPQASTVILAENAQYVKRAPATTAAPAAAAPVDSIVAGPQEYTVVANDSFSKIAARYGKTAEQIVQYNKFASLSHTLHVGDIIKIPPGAKNPAAAPSTTAAPAVAPNPGATATADASQGCTYTIKQGDWPVKVAKKFGITVQELETANPGGVMTTFLVGAQLNIPAGAKC